MEPFHNALEILNQIVHDEYISFVTEDPAYPSFTTSAYFACQYGISDRTFKRYIDDLRGLGADLYSLRLSSGQYVWRCRNWRELRQCGVLSRWLELEREKASGLCFDDPAPDTETETFQRVCVMNCGPAAGDMRSRAERQAACSDCEPVRVPNRAESKYHFDDKRFDKRSASGSTPPV